MAKAAQGIESLQLDYAPRPPAWRRRRSRRLVLLTLMLLLVGGAVVPVARYRRPLWFQARLLSPTLNAEILRCVRCADIRSE